jgi:hypothetical protein
MDTTPPQTAHEARRHTQAINWRRLGLHLLVALLVISAGVAWGMVAPSLALAQQGGPDPFAEAETKFDAFLKRLRFWVWGVSAMGLAFYVIAYGGQALWPSWYGSMRDFLRTGAVLIVLFNVVFAFLLNQATQEKGSVVIVLPYLLLLRAFHAPRPLSLLEIELPQRHGDTCCRR